MHNSFANRTCPRCGSTNLAHVVTWVTGEIPAGVEGEVVCRNCLYWEMLLTVAPAATVFDTERWVVLEAGQGAYSGDAERAQVTSYRDPDADAYPRYAY
jgi:hypothetical protein